MPDTIQRKRTWAACACPVCRFVFRVPKQHEGKGVVCPACLYLLQIPQKRNTLEDRPKVSNASITPAPRDEQKPKPISARPMNEAEPLSSEQAEDFSSSAKRSSSRRKRVRGKRVDARNTPEWEQESTQRRGSNKESGSPFPWLLGGGLLGLTVLGLGAWLVLGPTEDKSSADSALTGQWMPDDTAISLEDPEREPTAEDKKMSEAIQESIDTGTNILEEAQGIMDKFLSVKKVEDFRDLVRYPEQTMPRIKEWYKTRPIEGQGVNEVGYGGRASVNGKMASLAVQMEDYTLKQVAIEKTEDGYKVDWESWVGWTEMDWEELFKKRPTEPKTLLVRCFADTYYNRQFNDDTKWVAVKLTNPQSERTLYGYVDREDPALVRFLGDLTKGELTARLKIRYPENAVAGDQVIISEYLSAGWVAAAEEDKDGEKE